LVCLLCQLTQAGDVGFTTAKESQSRQGCHPSSVAESVHIQSLDEETRHAFGFTDHSFPQAYVISPKKHTISHKNSELWIVGHGTFASENPAFFDPNAGDTLAPVLQQLKEKTEQDGQCRVVAPYQWSGGPYQGDRVAAGNTLADFCNRHGQYFSSIHAVGHSHFLNVLKAASMQSYWDIDSAYILGGPVHERMQEGVKNITRLYHFVSIPRTWSDGDWVQLIGSYDDQKRGSSSERRSGRFEHSRSDGNVHNIEVVIDGLGPGHSDIRRIVPYMFSTAQTIESCKTGKLFGKDYTHHHWIARYALDTEHPNRNRFCIMPRTHTGAQLIRQGSLTWGTQYLEEDVAAYGMSYLDAIDHSADEKDGFCLIYSPRAKKATSSHNLSYLKTETNTKDTPATKQRVRRFLHRAYQRICNGSKRLLSYVGLTAQNNKA